MTRVIVFLLAALAASIAPAGAHTRSQSLSSWTVEGNRIEGVYQVDAWRTTQLSEEPQDLAALLVRHLGDTVSLSQDGKRCTMAPLRPLPAARGDLRIGMRFDCPHDFALHDATLAMGAFFGVSISHVHYIRLNWPHGEVQEYVLTQGHSNVGIGKASAETPSSFPSFVLLGFEHVLSGLDHIAFLVALAMLAGGLRRILIAVTGFTLGHSLTLALVATGVLRPDTAAIEALIGFTVAWAAGDALARRRDLPRWYGLLGAGGILLLPVMALILGLPVLSLAVLAGLALFAACMSWARGLDTARTAPAIATIFGLAHGAGFAGPLLDMKIMPGDLVWTLLAFNIGVELGQLAALAALGGILWALFRMRQLLPARAPEHAYDATAALLFALGTFWFVARALA